MNSDIEGPSHSPYTRVVGQHDLGLADDLDVVESAPGRRTRAQLHAESPLPQGSLL